MSKNRIYLIAGSVLFLALGLGLFFHLNRLERRLVGTWRDENSLVQYRADGVKIAKYDRGGVFRGMWYLDGHDVIYTPDDARQESNRKTIRSLSRNELVIEDSRVWHAKRVPNVQMTEALAGQ